jgi:hypothetical protein
MSTQPYTRAGGLLFELASLCEQQAALFRELARELEAARDLDNNVTTAVTGHIQLVVRELAERMATIQPGAPPLRHRSVGE